MAVNIRYADKELKALNYASAYILEDSKLKLSDTPTLIIGVGGTGVAAITRLKHSYERGYHPSQRLHFLGIDTDEGAIDHNTVSDEVASTKLDPHKHEWISLEGGIGKGLREHEHWSETIKQFCPKNSNIDPGLQGAGGYRVASRFLFFKNLKKIVKELKYILKNILAGYHRNGQQALNIFIATGIAGGTGSGASLDIAYLLRALLKKDFKLNSGDGDYIMNGYIVLPDVNDTIYENSYSHPNGYAYLKELDYFNSLGDHNETFRQTYGDYVYDGKERPFDLTYLFSAINNDGTLIENAFERTTINITESILDFLASGEDGESFIKSLTANINNNMDNLVNNREDVEYSRYVSFGNASFRLPQRELTQYLSARWFELLNTPSDELIANRLYANTPSTKDRDIVFRDLKLTFEEAVSSLQGAFTRGNSFDLNWQSQVRNGNYSYENVLVQKGTPVESLLHQDIIRPLQDYIIEFKRREREALKRHAVDLFDEMLVDAKRGPFYIAHLFGDGYPFEGKTEGHSVFRQIDDFMTAIDDAIATLKNHLRSATDIKDSFASRTPEKVSFGLFGDPYAKSKDEIVTGYINACIDEVECERRVREYTGLKEMMSSFREDLQKLYDEKYGRIIHILTRLRENSRDFMANQLPNLIKQSNESLEENTNVYSFVDFENMIKSVETNIIPQLNLAELKARFLETISANYLKFTDSNQLGIKEVLHDFLSTHIVRNLGATFLNLMKWAAEVELTQNNQVSFASVVDKTADDVQLDSFIQRKIATIFEQKSAVNINLSAARTDYADEITAELLSKEILVPNASSDLKYILGKTDFVVRGVDREDSLSAYQFMYGFPLYMLPHMVKYEVEYERALANNDAYSKSLHLSHTDEVSFTNLPSLIPVWERGEIRELSLADRQRQARQELYDDCCQHGFIQFSDDSPTASASLYLGDKFVSLKGNRENGKPLLHFRKLYRPIKELEQAVAAKKAELEQAVAAKKAELEQREAAKQWADRAKKLVNLLGTKLVQNDEGTFFYYVTLGEDRIDLGNLTRHKTFVEFEVHRLLDEKLKDKQRNLLYKKVEEVFDVLTGTPEGNQAWEEALEALSTRVDKARNSIIALDPENSEELTLFYDGLARTLLNYGLDIEV